MPCLNLGPLLVSGPHSLCSWSRVSQEDLAKAHERSPGLFSSLVVSSFLFLASTGCPSLCSKHHTQGWNSAQVKQMRSLFPLSFIAALSEVTGHLVGAERERKGFLLGPSERRPSKHMHILQKESPNAIQERRAWAGGLRATHRFIVHQSFLQCTRARALCCLWSHLMELRHEMTWPSSHSTHR